MASKLPLLVLLIAVTCLSQFYRVSNSVIAPELARDLHLSARQLGWAGSAFFFALFAVQLPVGLWFDRYGARRTVSAVSLLAVRRRGRGSPCATDAADLIAGRDHRRRGLRRLLHVGGVPVRALVRARQARDGAVAGCSPPPTSARWPAPRRSPGSPRPSAGATASSAWPSSPAGRGGLFYVVVRDRPPGLDRCRPRTTEPLREVVPRPVEVWRTRACCRCSSMHFFAYATMLTVLGVWGGPYLYDVHKLDGVQRGNVLLAMGVAQTLGILAYGPMDRLLHSRKKVGVRRHADLGGAAGSRSR